MSTWNPIATAPNNMTVLVYARGSMYVAWLVDDATDPYWTAEEGHSDWDGLWVVTDNKHGPYALRGASPSHWQHLPEPPNKD